MASDRPVLDWRPPPERDPRNRLFTISAQGVDTTKTLRSRNWTTSVILNQNTYDCPFCGQYGACVGFSCAHALISTPRDISLPPSAAAHAHDIYHSAKGLDVWPGTDYEGSSVHAGAKALKASGRLTGYWWLDDVTDLAHAVSRYGPVVVGTNWYEAMFDPSSAGMVTVAGDVAGGHAYLISGVDVAGNTFRITNSWGYSWGANGTARITFAEMARLLSEDAEAILPRKVAAPTAVTS